MNMWRLLHPIDDFYEYVTIITHFVFLHFTEGVQYLSNDGYNWW